MIERDESKRSYVRVTTVTQLGEICEQFIVHGMHIKAFPVWIRICIHAYIHSYNYLKVIKFKRFIMYKALHKNRVWEANWDSWASQKSIAKLYKVNALRI